MNVLAWNWITTPSGIYGQLDFPVLLFLGEALIAQFFPRKKHFWIKLILSVILVTAFYFLRDLWAIEIDWLQEVKTYSMSFVTFLLSLVGIWICFDASLPSIMMAGTIGYCIQNFSYCLMSIIRMQIGFPQEKFWFILPILLPIFGITHFCLYYFYLKKPDYREEISQIHEKRQIITTLICIGAIAVLSTESMKVAYVSQNDENWYILYLYNIAVCLISVISEFELLRSRKHAADQALIKNMWENDKKNFARSRENMEAFNIRLHDLRHRMDSLGSQPTEKDLQDLKTAMENYNTLTTTNCDTFDLVIYEKTTTFLKDKIHFTCLVDAHKLTYLPQESLYSIFENALSNAIEAVEKIPEEERIISVKSVDLGEFVNLHIENLCDPKNTNTEIRKTTKDNKVIHGYGMKSIQMMMEKYGGQFKASLQGNVFALDLLFVAKEMK